MKYVSELLFTYLSLKLINRVAYFYLIALKGLMKNFKILMIIEHA